MIMRFQRNVRGILTACRATEKYNDIDIIFSDERSLSTQLIGYAENEIETQRSSSFDTLWDNCSISQLVAAVFFRNDPGAIDSYQSPVEFIETVLRHRKCNPLELVGLLKKCKGRKEMLYIPQYREGHRYFRYMKEVKKEFYHMCMFTRPELFGNVLIARVSTDHRTSDMFCQWLARKNPDIVIGVIDKNISWIGNGNLLGFESQVCEVDPSFLVDLQSGDNADKGLEDLWEIYYDSQYISKRRNRKLASRMQPAISANFSTMAKNDRYRVEKGTGNCTLDEFSKDCENL